jgi:transposase InsO family protein
MIFQRPLLLSINKNAVQRRKHPARNERYGFPIPSRMRPWRLALSERNWKAEELIHHSDQGVQYASSDYTQILDQAEIQISMSRSGNPYDNARAERFMRTLKEEEVHGTEYRDLEDARGRIGEFLEQV